MTRAPCSARFELLTVVAFDIAILRSVVAPLEPIPAAKHTEPAQPAAAARVDVVDAVLERSAASLAAPGRRQGERFESRRPSAGREERTSIIGSRSPFLVLTGHPTGPPSCDIRT